MQNEVQEIGIPFAFWDMAALDRNELIHVCPVCDERIQEKSPKGKNYQTHYARAHA